MSKVKIPKSLSNVGCAGVLITLGIASSLGLLLVPAPKAEPKATNLPQHVTQKPKPKAKPKPKPKKGPRYVKSDRTKNTLDKIKWQEIFRDDFEREEIGDNWHLIGDSKWKIDNGTLFSNEALHNNGGSNTSILCSGMKLPRTFRFEYDCKMRTGSNKPNDLSFMYGTPKGINEPRYGYLFRFGSYGNTWGGLGTKDQEGIVKDTTAVIENGKSYHVVIMKKGKHVFMSINDKVIVCGIDKYPPKFPKEVFGGLYTWSGDAEFDNVVISKPGK